MNRPDGTRVKNATAVVQALPYIMPKRYDAQNWANDYVDDDILRAYIREKKKEDKRLLGLENATADSMNLLEELYKQI